MGGKKIYHISDLPEWFSLENYEATESFNAANWAYPLERRFVVHWLLNQHGSYYDDRAQDEFSRILLEDLHRPEWSSKEVLAQAAKDIESIIEKDYLSHNTGFRPGFTSGLPGFVQPIKCGWAWYMAQDLEEHYGLNKDGELDDIGTPIIKYYKDNNPRGLNTVPIMIDLKGSDVDIKNEFSRFLQHARDYTSIKNKKSHITDSDLDKLQKYRILPYADLRLWGDINNRTISAKSILDALFSSDEDIQAVGEPFIAQTLKPFYEKVITEDFIYALDHYIEK
mgnify:CR=1 FL=1